MKTEGHRPSLPAVTPGRPFLKLEASLLDLDLAAFEVG
jgi:hypothetical protein